jgi:hypothetical protein
MLGSGGGCRQTTLHAIIVHMAQSAVFSRTQLRNGTDAARFTLQHTYPVGNRHRYDIRLFACSLHRQTTLQSARLVAHPLTHAQTPRFLSENGAFITGICIGSC